MSAKAEPRVIRRADYREAAWRNGGGVTLEIAREPAGVDEFAWRLSLARVDRDGPFSAYPGYLRALTLIEGAGCRLHGLPGETKELRKRGATVFFPGDASVHCELLAGPCSDLNLMVRTSGQILSVDQFDLPFRETESLRPDCWNAVFCFEGVVDCLHLPSGARVALQAHDTLIANAAEAADWRLLRAAMDSRVIVHAWRD